jgi:hypothetical protein
LTLISDLLSLPPSNTSLDFSPGFLDFYLVFFRLSSIPPTSNASFDLNLGFFSEPLTRNYIWFL